MMVIKDGKVDIEPFWDASYPDKVSHFWLYDSC